MKVRWEKGEEGYLNANVVKGEGERWWVASQVSKEWLECFHDY